MNKITFVASCPICGRTLFKGRPKSYIEGGCPKCKEYLCVIFTDSGYEISRNISKIDIKAN